MKTDYRLISQSPDFRDCLLDYLDQSNITRAMLADFIHVSPAALHKILIYKKCNFSLETIEKIVECFGIEIRKNGQYEIYEYGEETETMPIKAINKSNLGTLESAFFQVNESILDSYDYEYPIFELQEFIVEHETGLNTLIASLSPANKAKLMQLGHRTLRDNILEMHRRNGELIPDNGLELLRIAVRTHLRQCKTTEELKINNFPGGYSWELTTLDDIPF